MDCEKLAQSDILNLRQDALKKAIGCVLLDNSVLPMLRSAVKPEELPPGIGRMVYEKALAMEDRGDFVSCVSLSFEFLGDKEFVDKGGVNYIMQAPTEVAFAGEIHACVRAIKKFAHTRKLRNLSAYLEIAAKTESVDIPATIRHIDEEIAEIREFTEDDHWSGIGDIVVSNFESMMNGSRYDPSKVITTGFVDLDRLLTGLKPGTVTIIAACPGMGKTVLGLNIASYNAFTKEIPVAFFSLEMQKMELGDRIISSFGSINGNAIRTGKFTQDEMARLSQTAERLSKSDLLQIIDIGGMEIRQLESEAKKICKTHGCRLIVMDYLQLARCEGKRIQNENQEITEISRSLKSLAKALNIPIIAMAQINRGVADRADKHPLLSDIRGSGSIEQDADNVIFIYRDDYYHPNDTPTNIAEVIVAKQRAGATGCVKLRWSGAFSRFDNLETENF